MKKYLLLALLVCGCVRSEQQSGAENAAEEYIKKMVDSRSNLESVSFSALEKRRYKTKLDSSLTVSNSGISGDDYKKMQKFVDSENAVMPDASIQNLKDIDNIERGKLDYYLLIYTFKIDSAGVKRTKRYRFELDSLNNILDAKDVTHVRNLSE
jgi:hypothetical protein